MIETLTMSASQHCLHLVLLFMATSPAEMHECDCHKTQSLKQMIESEANLVLQLDTFTVVSKEEKKQSLLASNVTPTQL